MKKIGKKPTDDQILEGGGAGVGGTKWSSMPSFKGNANIVDDFKKLTKDTSHLKGGAKKSADLAEERAAKRMGVRAAGAGTVAGIAKGLSGSGAAAEEDTSKKVRQRSADEASTQPTPPQKSGKTYDPNMSIKGKLYEGRNPEIGDDTREAAGTEKAGYKRGGKVASKASSRGDGIAQRGKTKGRMI
jgi:hypothetical protein